MMFGRFFGRSYGPRSHSRKGRLALQAMATAVMVAAPVKHVSAQLYWDLNGATSGAGGTTPSGTWDLTSNNWDGTSAGTGTPSTWTAGNQAVFAAGTDATGAYTVTVAPGVSIPGVNGISFEEGTLTINGGAGSSIILSNGSISTLGTQTINATIGGSAGLIRGSGTLVLTLGGSNTYTGQTQILTTGRINATNSNAFGSTAPADNIIFSPSAGLASPSFVGMGISLLGNINIGKAIVINGGSGFQGGQGEIDNLSGSNTWSGPISIGPSAQNLGSGLPMITASSGTLTIPQGITGGAVGVGYAGAGTIILQGNATYTGITRMFSGHIIVQSGAALGTGGIFMLSATASSNQAYQQTMVGLQPTAGSMSFTTPIGQLSGMPFIGKGLLENLSGDNIDLGNVTLTNGAPFTTGTPVIPTPIGVTSGSLRMNGAIVNSSTANQRSLVKVGPGLLSLAGTSTFTGPTIIEAGTLAFVGNGSDTALPAGSFTGGATNTLYGDSIQVNPGTSLRLDNTEASLATRIAPNSTPLTFPVMLYNGDLSIVGNGTTSTNITTLGTELDLFGTSSITVSQPGAGVTLNVASTNRSSNATAVFRGSALGTGAPGAGVSTVLLPSVSLSPGGGTPGTPSVGIIPWALGDVSTTTGTGTDFVTYDTTNGVRLLTPSEYDTTNAIDGATAGNNVQLSTAVTINNPTTVNSIKFAPGASSLVLNNTATINSGAILNATGGLVTISGGGTVQFGGQEGIIHANSDVRIDAQVSAGGGLTKGGAGNLTLTNTSNSISQITLDAGNVIVSDEGQIGGGGTPITFNGGFLQPASNLTALSGSHNIMTASGGGMNVPTNQTLSVSDNITGAGSFQKAGGGLLILSGNNSGLTGAVVLRAGTLEVGSANAISSQTPVAAPSGVADN